jgi:hypothetical protein
MARCSAVNVAAGVGTTARPGTSLYATAAISLYAREVGTFNTTTTAARYEVLRLTNATTQGAGITETALFPSDHTVLGTAFLAHTADTGQGGIIAPMPVGAAIGAGTILTYYGENGGIMIPVGTANGIGIQLATGTGQIRDDYFIWDE